MQQNPEMKKRMLKMLIGLAILFGLIVIYKVVKSYMIDHFIAEDMAKPVYVSAIKADYAEWQPHYDAVGSLRAVLGVNVTTEAAGMIRTISFVPGQVVKKGAVLVMLDTDPDVAQLHALQATANLAQITYKRDSAQYAIHAISKETLDTDLANLQSAQADVAQQQALIAEKIVHAPFDGRLGICQVNPGQYLKPGDKVTSLETLNPVYADFYVPQTALPQFKTGEAVTLSDENPNQVFTGKITTIDSAIDPKTRNIEIEATITNPKDQLVPGMFAPMQIVIGAAQHYLTLPQTAISFNSYGEEVYVLKPTGKKDKDGNALMEANQVFVTTGDSRGDQIAILQGIKAGDLVVTGGQLKLKNGSIVVINNAIQPADNAAPTAAEQTD